MYPGSDKNYSYETDDVVYFFSNAFDPLNNWSAHQVKVWDILFTTVEHAYHYRKFDQTAPQVAQEILAAPSPWAAMQIERRHNEKRRKDWQAAKVGIMTEIIRAKVKQNQDVCDCLLKTGTKQIIENSPWDSFWGIGEDGKGKNVMGYIFMQIRKELQEGKI